MSKKKRPIFSFLKESLRIFYRKSEYIGTQNLPQTPAIFIANHAQLHGPLCCTLRFPVSACIWCRGEVMRLKEAPGYAFRDFWAYKPKRYRWFYKLLSFCIAPALVYLCKSAEAIPVYTDRRYLLTVRATLEKLENGKSIIIFPECHTRYNAIVNEFKEGFAELAAYYYKRYGKEISFVPVYIAPKIKKVVFGSPVKYDPSVPIEEQRLAICNHLKSEITAAANSLPVHTVIPYANIPKKEYPVSQISGKNSVRNIDFDIER